MRKLVSLLLVLTGTPVWACQDLGKTTFDSLDSVGFSKVSFGTATVVDVALFMSESGSACMELAYEKGTAEIGDFPTRFSVQSCWDDGNLVDVKSALDDPDFAVFGYQAGAMVGLGLVSDEQKASGYRYLVPDCWGPASLRLDSEDQDLSKKSSETWARWVRSMQQEIQKRTNLASE